MEKVSCIQKNNMVSASALLTCLRSVINKLAWIEAAQPKPLNFQGPSGVRIFDSNHFKSKYSICFTPNPNPIHPT
jgi:hypothetical protein